MADPGSFEQSSAQEPGDAGIWNNLGLALWEEGRLEESIACYERALAIQPNRPDTTMNLGVVLADLWRLDEALVQLQAARRMAPGSVEVLQNLAMTLARRGDCDEALDLFEQAVRLRPDYAEVHRNRALVWLNQGNFERGWPEYEWRLKCRRHPGVVVARPFWRGEDLSGRLLLLHYEGGSGDTLQFIRFAPILKERGACVLVLCQTNVLRLVARAPGVDLAFDGTTVQPDCELHAPLLSLPALLGTTLANLPARVPYLRTDPLLVEFWRSKLAAAIGVEESQLARDEAHGNARADERRPFLIGVAWQGNPKHTCDRLRSFPLARLAPLAELP
jgi:hypothetical protein